MSKEIERHRKIWKGKSDEWIFERIAYELKYKVEQIHRLLTERDQLQKEKEELENFLDNSNLIKEKAREMDEKQFAQWIFDEVFKP